MSKSRLSQAKQTLPYLTKAELKELREAIDAELTEETSLISAHEYHEGLTKGVQVTLDTFDEYQTPAVKSAIDLSFLMGLVCGIPLAGFGELPKESAKISDMEADNRRLAVGFDENLGAKLPHDWFYTQGATQLREALVAYYSGEDHGQQLATILNATSELRALLELKNEFKPGRKPDLPGLLMDQLVADSPGATWQEKALNVMHNLQRRGEYPEVVARIEEIPYEKRGDTLRNRQTKRRGKHIVI